MLRAQFSKSDQVGVDCNMEAVTSAVEHGLLELGDGYAHPFNELEFSPESLWDGRECGSWKEARMVLLR